jgi:hypothetical protein
MVFVDDEALRGAIAASDTAYRLLVWLGSLVDAERLSASQIEAVLSSPHEAMHFLDTHHNGLPDDIVFGADSREATANILGSYLNVSFDLNHDPGSERRPDPVCGASCPFCWSVRQGPHLTPKRLTKADRRRADRLSAAAVEELTSGGFVVGPAERGPEWRRDAATIAYGNDLVGRAAGSSAGPYALALWRRFAWKKGSRDRGFVFTVASVERARLTFTG